MQKIYTLLGVLVFITSCNLQNKSDDRAKEVTLVSAAQTPPVKQQEINKLEPDAEFLVKQDTVSAVGPYAVTRNLFEDKNGNIWLASWQGIIRYDGKVFTNYTLKFGLERIHAISGFEDKMGNLWFGTLRAGVYKYDGVSFKHYTTKDGMVSDFVNCMMEDREGNIWLGTDLGVSKLTGNTFTNYTEQDGLNSNFVSAIVQDKTGQIWLGSKGGVNCYYPSISASGKIFSNFADEKGERFVYVRSIIEDKTGSIWLGSQNGLYNFINKKLNKITSNSTNYICEDKNGNLWLSESRLRENKQSLLRYDGKKFDLIKSENQVFGIIQDKNENIWFGTDKGICKYDGTNFIDFSKKGLK